MILTDESQMPYGLHATLSLRNYNHQGNDLAVFNYVTENYQLLQDEFTEFNKYRKTI